MKLECPRPLTMRANKSKQLPITPIIWCTHFPAKMNSAEGREIITARASELLCVLSQSSVVFKFAASQIKSQCSFLRARASEARFHYDKWFLIQNKRGCDYGKKNEELCWGALNKLFGVCLRVWMAFITQSKRWCCSRTKISDSRSVSTASVVSFDLTCVWRCVLKSRSLVVATFIWIQTWVSLVH